VEAVEPTPTPQTDAPVEADDPEYALSTFFADPAWKTSNAAIKVDGQGGIHMAYYYYEPEYSATEDSRPPTSAVYRYCAAQCDQERRWDEIKLLRSVNEVQLAVTSTGKPRLLIRADRDSNGKDEYLYTACDSDCTSTGGWETVEVLESGDPYLWQLYDDGQPQRSFALDPLDRPRFVYMDYNYSIEPDRYGTYYLYCDAGCLDGANWGEVHIGPYDDTTYRYEMFEYPALAFTSQGQPRIAAAFNALGDEDYALHYLGCDSACEDEDNWGRAKLWARGQGENPGWDIALDAQDRPRIAFYPEAMEDGSGEQLYYAWCDQDCFETDSWTRANLGLGEDNGADPDLVFDDAGNPWIAFIAMDGSAVGVVGCERDCTSPQATWTDFLIDTYEVLEAEWELAVAPTCEGGIWQAWTPSMVFDRVGNLRLAYDATYHAYCWWDTDYQRYVESYQFYLIERSVRGVLLTQEK
jgi:hypothetical protein